MQVCFIDESGYLGVLGNPPLPNDQPVLVIGGLFVDVANLASLTYNLLNLKRQYFPRLPYPSSKPLDRILPEAKGADVRGNARTDSPSGSRTISTYTLRFPLVSGSPLRLHMTVRRQSSMGYASANRENVVDPLCPRRSGLAAAVSGEIRETDTGGHDDR